MCNKKKGTKIVNESATYKPRPGVKRVNFVVSPKVKGGNPKKDKG